MSHSVFRDLDPDKTCGNSSRSDIADNNLIIFINKDGDMQVDPDALQDLCSSANTQTKSTVSVIRVGSPTPSMEAESNRDSEANTSGDDDGGDDGDGDDNDTEDEDSAGDADTNSSNKSDESNDSDESDSEESSGAKRSRRKKNKRKANKKKKKKKKNKVPGVSLMVEEFFDPEQAVKFAAEIMNIAGITDPKRIKENYERLRYIIQNDHCYTPFMPADAAGTTNADDKAETTSRDSKPKPLVKLLANTSATSSGTVAKKPGRGQQANGLDKDAAERSRAKSSDDTNSSAENNGDSGGGDDDDDEETDFSDFTPSESDNDRDSDLDFSVHDSHSRRAKKMSKQRTQKSANKATRQQGKKRRSSALDPASDDGSTPNRKKTPKASTKKSVGGSAKVSSSVTPSTSSALKTPVASSTPRFGKGGNAKETPPAGSALKEGSSGPRGSGAQVSAGKSNAKASAQATKSTGAGQSADPAPNPKASGNPANRPAALAAGAKGAPGPKARPTGTPPTASLAANPKQGATQPNKTPAILQPAAQAAAAMKGSAQPPTRSAETGPAAAHASNPKGSAQAPKPTGMLPTAANPKPPQIAKPTAVLPTSPVPGMQRNAPQAHRPIGTLQAGEPRVITQPLRVVDESRKVFTTAVRTMPIAVTTDAGGHRSMILIRQNQKPKDADKAAAPTALYTIDRPRQMAIDAASAGQKLVRVTMVGEQPNAHTVTMRLADTNVFSSRITYTNKALQRHQAAGPRPAPVAAQPMKLPSEQDKQLDLINSLVQAELSRPESTMSVASMSDAPMPAAIPSIVRMLETPIMASIDNDALAMANDFDASVDDQLLPVDLLDSIDNPEELSDDLMRDVARLVDEDKTLRDAIDEEVRSQANARLVSSGVDMPMHMMAMTSTVVAPPAPVAQPPKPIILNSLRPIGAGLADANTVQYVTKIVTGPGNTTTATMLKEPIRVKRSDGRIIVLPPIEAPTTRGAKRRAEVVCTPEMPPRSKVIVTAAAADEPEMKSPLPIDESPLKREPPAKAKPVAVQDRRSSVAAKNSPQRSKIKRSLSISNPPQFDDLDDEADGSDYSANSEDDPHRLWCICQTPHNNRFMICCDKCLEWFHGKCVGITKSIGKDIEQRGSEWICPKCKKKQQPSIQNMFSRQLSNMESAANTSGNLEAGSSNASKPLMPDSSPTSRTHCAACGVKAARTDSSYCSDECAQRHAQSASRPNVSAHDASTVPQSDALDAHAKQTTIKMVQLLDDGDRRQAKTQSRLGQPLFRDKANRVVVYERDTEKFLTGKSAPGMDKLEHWLKLHPNYEVLKPGTPQAIAFKAKQLQLKSLARELQAKELFSVSQPAKIQTTLRIEPDKKIGIHNPLQRVQVKKVSAAGAAGAAGATTPTATTPTTPTPKSGSSPFARPDSIAKNPKLTATPQPSSKRRPDDSKTPQSAKRSTPSPASAKSSERDQLRSNARKTMISEIASRSKEITDPNVNRLSDTEIGDFVTAVEAEMFAMFGHDTNMKYKAKYRSLIFNIKDRKNKTLFEKISNRIIEPKKLVRLSPEELASQELAKWRENENKHQLEMITKSELDLLALGNSYVLKTHKGEEVIQENSGIDAAIAVKDVVLSALSQSAVSSSSEVGEASTPAKERGDRHPNDASKAGGSSKRDSDRSRRDRHDSKSSGSSSSRHKRKRSRDRHHSSRDRSRDAKRDKRDGERDRDRDRDKSKGRGADSRKDKKEYKASSSTSSNSSSTSRTKHSDKDAKGRDAGAAAAATAAPTKTAPAKSKADEHSIIDKILKAQSAIDSILHPNDAKRPSDASAPAAEAQPPVRAPSANESDQEPSSTVTIPTPPERTPESVATPPPPSQDAKLKGPPLYTGNISMIDVTTIRMSISALSGNLTNVDFPKRDIDICGRIPTEIVWRYLNQIRLSREIAWVLFSVENAEDHGAYVELLEHLNSRKRMGVIKDHCKSIKDYYVMPVPAKQSLPQVVKAISGLDVGTNHRGLLIGIIIRHKTVANNPASKVIQRQTIPFPSHKAPASTPATKDTHYTPPASPNIAPAPAKPSAQPFTASNVDEDEPYSPGGSEDDDSLNSLPFLSTSAGPSTDYPKMPSYPVAQDIALQRKFEELNRQIEAEKKQIAMHLQAVDIDEPYSPTSSVSPTINPNLSDVVSNISIPANLADILKNISSVPVTNVASTSNIGQTSSQMAVNPYTLNAIDASDEYVPTASSTTPLMSYPTSAPAQVMRPAAEPSKLAQLTEEELMRMVPDDF